jgi:hypothetical protein
MDARMLLPIGAAFKGLDILGAIISIIILLFCSTYLVTTCRFFIGSLGDRRHKGKQPLTLPYWIPFLGSSIFMATNGHAFYETAM